MQEVRDEEQKGIMSMNERGNIVWSIECKNGTREG